MVQHFSRRRILYYSCLIGLAGLSGCTRNESEDSTETPTSTPSPEASPPDSSEGSESEEATDSERTIQISITDEVITAVDATTDEEFQRGNDARTIIQAGIDRLEDGGTVSLEAGTYVIDGGEILIRSDITLLGEGPRETVLKRADGLNEEAQNVIRIGGDPIDVADVEIRDLEIDGNESNNRSIQPYPESPSAHGLLIHAEGVTVDNLYIHDSIRSNIVLLGSDCRLTNLELANAATDHWIYLASAEDCVIEDVHASGFVRGGLTFGTDGESCRNNTLSNIVLEGAAEPPFEDQLPSDPLQARYPLIVCVFRNALGEAYGNTIKNLRIGPPADDGFSQQIVIAQRDSTIQNLEFVGPAGFNHNVLQIGGPWEGGAAPGTEISNVNFDLTHEGPVTDDGPLANPSIIKSYSGDVTLEDVTIKEAVDQHAGVSITGQHHTISNTTLRDFTVRSHEKALTIDGTTNPVRDLVIEDFRDNEEAGIETRGDVSFASKDIE